MKKKVIKKKVVRKSTVAKTRNAGTMTESAFFSKIRSVLRRGFMYWIPMQKALKLASRPNQSANKRLLFEYQCACCKKWFPRKEVHIDHIIEAGSLLSYNDVAPFLENLLDENVKAYQVLCKKKCHAEKSKKYNAERRELRKLNKK